MANLLSKAAGRRRSGRLSIPGKVNLGEAAQILSVSYAALRAMVDAGELGEALKYGRQVFLDAHVVEAAKARLEKERAAKAKDRQLAYAKRVKRATETIRELVALDDSLDADVRRKVYNVLDVYSHMADAMVVELGTGDVKAS